MTEFEKRVAVILFVVVLMFWINSLTGGISGL
jgi:hypothetical protein